MPINDVDFGKLVEQVRANGEKLDRLLRVIDGNGDDGIKTTISKHDEWIQARTRIEWVFKVAIIGLIVKEAWPYLL